APARARHLCPLLQLHPPAPRDWPAHAPPTQGGGDVADILSGVLHRTITFSARTAEEDRDAMITVGVPAPIAEQNAHAFSLIAIGDAEWLSDDTTEILGHPGRTFQQFAEDHANAFTSRLQPGRAGTQTCTGRPDYSSPG